MRDAQKLKKRQKALGSRMRDIRLSKRLSQEEVAAGAGIVRTHYGRIERGQQGTSVEVLLAIADALAVHVTQLFKDPPATDQGMHITIS